MADWLTRNAWGRFRDDQHGGVIIIAAIALPALVIGAGVTIDYGLATRDRVIMQAAADATAIAAARELSNGHLTDQRLIDTKSHGS